jgi:hypothetical protein
MHHARKREQMSVEGSERRRRVKARRRASQATIASTGGQPRRRAKISAPLADRRRVGTRQRTAAATHCMYGLLGAGQRLRCSTRAKGNQHNNRTHATAAPGLAGGIATTNTRQKLERQHTSKLRCLQLVSAGVVPERQCFLFNWWCALGL